VRSLSEDRQTKRTKRALFPRGYQRYIEEGEMEAGREGEGRKGVRIRLRFEDESILSNLQRQEGLAKCWYWIHSGVVSIAHLASDIAVAFDLLNSCPNGVLLEVRKRLLDQ
jgi:hypothetical protein